MLPDADSARGVAGPGAAVNRAVLEGLCRTGERRRKVLVVLRSLATADPVGRAAEAGERGACQRREAEVGGSRYAVAGAGSRPIRLEAEAVAERSRTRTSVSWACWPWPMPCRIEQRDRKLALLDRAAVQAKAATVPPDPPATRWAKWPSDGTSWGRRKRPRRSSPRDFSWRTRSRDKTDPRRGRFAARLARVDLPSALAIAKEFPASGSYSASWVLRNIAFRLAADNPAEAERVLRQIPRETGETGSLRRLPGRWPRSTRRAPGGWSKNRSGISTTRRCICSSPSA